jgi:acyl transferase domain-containing protein
MAGLPWVIPTSLSPWPSGYDRRIAGVSSFGFSGTNAHVVMEEAEAPVATRAPAKLERPVHLLALSAKTAPALEEIVTRLDEYVAANPAASLASFGFAWVCLGLGSLGPS